MSTIGAFRRTAVRMAGHHHDTLHMDPALVRYANMYVHRHEYFRWTPKTAWNSIAFIIVIPSIIGYIGWKYDGKWEMRAKLRGDTVSEW